jgi:hypothetical protein
MWEDVRPAFNQDRTWEKAYVAAVSLIACLGKHTITGILRTSGQQSRDWTAIYRLFSKNRIDLDSLWASICNKVTEMTPADQPIFALMDDTHICKSGHKIPGTSWRRDPLGPHFSTNFIWSSRHLQISIALPEDSGLSRARAIPIEFLHCPTAKRPSKKASDEEMKEYRKIQNETRISKIGASEISSLRQQLDGDESTKNRVLVVSVDGGYTNAATYRSVPHNTVVIGRTRKDAKLFAKPTDYLAKGRRRIYGDELQTPEQVRQDDSISWQSVNVFAAGKMHAIDVKVIENVRWKSAGKQDLTLIVIRPLAYRLTKNSKLLYKQPAYLLVTPNALSLPQVLQAYIWRWEIEVSFRDEKTLLGLGEAQVRTPESVAKVPAFVAATYALMHLAATQTGITAADIPQPKWNKPKDTDRCSTQQIKTAVREELWGSGIHGSFSGFADNKLYDTKPLKRRWDPAQAVIYAQ